ncbi:DUF6271 family protein [Teredinibacter sp. KSP-S5-2]|uniref:DUF6271 family protein n=1 Tax=Teredinibacter sp. KSP-S5-2 TaxID=3034506 RepID=UPI0029345CBD|nr:DUF6271 family protein [Teredinibacter sp. KSP-S5-2]WNO11111.1 DUF6271 family protein [Teredinibacter sp. KSP-S5-2]
MKKICLSLPTNRRCVEAIALLAEEAKYAIDTFAVEVCLLVLDTSEGNDLIDNRNAVLSTSSIPGLQIIHMDEQEQQTHLRAIIDATEGAQRCGLKTEELIQLMLPQTVSYGACTNRVFLLAKALGCCSVHRRDSDSHYQKHNGQYMFPIYHELNSIGKVAATCVDNVTEHTLSGSLNDKRVAMVAGSFIGEMSVDLADIQSIDAEAYRTLVALWADSETTEEQKNELVSVSFKGAGTERFKQDYSLLGVVDPMRIDMCNICFFDIQEQLPLPPVTETIGSDYFLMHVLKHTQTPGVYHNRHIENYYTKERKTDEGFIKYHTRYVRFLMSMPYFHSIYSSLERCGEQLLTESGQIDIPRLTRFIKQSLRLGDAENRKKLTVAYETYQRLGGRYAEFAKTIPALCEAWQEKTEQGFKDYIHLILSWRGLMSSAESYALKLELQAVS